LQRLCKASYSTNSHLKVFVVVVVVVVVTFWCVVCVSSRTYCPTKDDENCLLRFEVVSKEDPTRILSTRHVHCLNGMETLKTNSVRNAIDV
jgi:hypothetical protein